MERDLHATRRGDGPPVILLHSGGMSSRQWKRLGDELATTHLVIAPDFLGSGDNPPWPAGADFHIGMDVDAIAAIVAGLDQPVHLVGHSYGGLVALSVARRDPSRVASVAAYDPVAFGVLAEPRDAVGLDDLSQAAKNPVFTDEAVGGTDAWFEVFVDYWNGPGAWRALPTPARESFLRVGRKVFLEVRSLMDDRTPGSAYAGITAPALLITGSASPPAAQRVVARLAESLPAARAMTVEGAGHMGPITHARVVVDAIASHVRAASG